MSNTEDLGSAEQAQRDFRRIASSLEAAFGTEIPLPDHAFTTGLPGTPVPPPEPWAKQIHFDLYKIENAIQYLARLQARPWWMRFLGRS